MKKQYFITTDKNLEFIIVSAIEIRPNQYKYIGYQKLTELTWDEKSFKVPSFTGRSFVSFNRVYNHLRKGMTPVEILIDGRSVIKSVYMVNEINR